MASSLPPVQFSASRRAQIDHQCDDLIDRALSTHDKFHASASLSGWQRVRRRNAMNVYRPRSAQGSEGPRVLLGSGIVPGKLDDALNGVYCDSTESLRICKSLLSDKFVDGAVLRVFEARDFRAPIVFAGIKWFIMRGFAGASGLLSDKDMLTYERMGRIRDRNGQYFAYHVLQSIDLPERPANRERGLQRVDISWCYLYRQLSPDWLGVFMLGDMTLDTVIPVSISSFISAERVLSAGDQSNTEWSASNSGFDASMRLGKLAEFTRQCHDSIAMKEETIAWNQEELLEISQFLESSSCRGENSSSSAISTGRKESPGYEKHYDYSDSPTAENLHAEENKYFEEESVESGPWTECLPNERSGKWTVVFDEDRQEYVRIRVPVWEEVGSVSLTKAAQGAKGAIMTAVLSTLIKGEKATAGMDSILSVAAAPVDVESIYIC
ncbi:hypothetical protein JG688_00008640 [Phytophthora aleatoria]|uniref:START domain-containing protein n=1 Tax=Phytophthora aleatoria TaxID=2496075 RepID=A0A8J5MG48_9STRA|nr:hypothetical protein JG688_00008640 [Phytophthora aleatoria]